MKVLGAYRDGAGAYYRMAAPFSAIAYRYPDHEFVMTTPTTGAVTEYDLLWLYGHANAVSEIIAREFKDAGKPVIYDIDDWLPGLPASWPGYDDYFYRGAAVPRESFYFYERLIAMADVVTCPTALLAEKLRQYHGLGDVRVLPNCVMQGAWDTLNPKSHNLDGPVIGWFGTDTHWDDWSEIVEAVDQAVAEVGGYLALLGAPEIAAMFPPRLQARTKAQPLVPVGDLRGVRELVKSFDVGLAWCIDRFTASRCRSPLKVIQYGAAGVPVIASDTVYGGLLGWEMATGLPGKEYVGVTATQYGLTVDGAGSLAGALVAAVEQYEAMEEKAHAWQQEVWREHTYERQARRWVDLAVELGKGVVT